MPRFLSLQIPAKSMLKVTEILSAASTLHWDFPHSSKSYRAD
jgi:hypothetical protein